MVSLRLTALMAVVACANAFSPSGFLGATVSAPAAPAPARQPVKSTLEMRARNCDLTGKSPNRQAMVVTFSHKRNKKVQHVKNVEEMEEALNTLQKDSLLKEMECFGLDNRSFLKRKANTPKNKIVTALLRGVNKKVQSSRP